MLEVYGTVLWTPHLFSSRTTIVLDGVTFQSPRLHPLQWIGVTLASISERNKKKTIGFCDGLVRPALVERP